MKALKRILLIVLLGNLYGCSYLPEELKLYEGIELTETANYIYLKPEAVATKTTGFMFYPGGLVDPHAYIPTLKGLAEEGYAVVILKVAANLAILSGGKSQNFLKNFEGIGQWVISGHSLGAVVASMDVDQERDDYVGLVLMAGYPASSNDLSGWGGAVLSLSGSEDKLATAADIEENKNLLPEGIEVNQLSDMPIGTTSKTIYHSIAGGNHAQFGAYGAQEGDGQASISSAAQQEEIVAYILSFYHSNQWQ